MYPKKWREETRARILADPAYLASLLGSEVLWFHRLWLEWTMRHPFSLITGPRAFGKSHIATVIMAIWWLLEDHNTRIMIVSKTDDAARAFVKNIREILETSSTLKACFGEFMGASTWRDDKIHIAQRKLIFPEATVEARGLGGQVARTHWNHVILDDPQDFDRSVAEGHLEHDIQWFDEVLLPTVLDEGTISMRATCYAWNDLRGRIEERAGPENIFDAEDLRLGGGPLQNGSWRVLRTAAILRNGESLWPERFPLYDRLEPNGKVKQGLLSKRKTNPPVFERQYQQICPKPKEGDRGTVFKIALFKAWEAPPDPTKLRLFMRHDPAWTSREEAARRTSRDRKPDFTAITVAGIDPATGRWYTLDHYRGLLSDREGMEKAREIALAWMPKGLRRYRVERTGLQVSQAPAFYRQLRELMPIPVEFWNPQRNKVAHAEPFALAILNDRVRWNPAIFETYPDLKENFDLFPTKGVHDDDVDSIAGAFLMGERVQRSLAAHIRQALGGAAAAASPTADTARRAVPPGASGQGISARIVPRDAGGGFSHRAVPRAW